MGPDHGIQRILKTGAGSMGSYGFAGAVWARGETIFAEARVFVRESTPAARGMLETIRVEARESEEAIALLRARLEERFGRLRWCRWYSTGEPKV